MKHYHRPGANPRTQHDHTPAQALSTTLASPSGAARVCTAIFATLTADQQDQVLQALGWVPSTPPSPTFYWLRHSDQCAALAGMRCDCDQATALDVKGGGNG